MYVTPGLRLGVGNNVCVLLSYSAHEFQWKQWGNSRVKKRKNNEAVYQRYQWDIMLKHLKRVVTVNGVIFPFFFTMELFSFACSYFVK